MSNTVIAEPTSIATYMENAYLDYSMYVVLDRALPHLGDGLKPVQRRIIYAMNGLGLSHQSKHKKSARTVGDVLGKYHPHGDSACYEAMVMMAQPFSYRNPVVDGQGNWGSPDDPKSFAAMRYTEARLTPYAQVLLKELSKDTVDYQPNFDGSLAEPVLLPAQVPNILLNGASGIAVGMATDIPPHNLGEVIKATQHVIEHPEASVEDVMQFIPGPDLPTGGTLITSPADLAKSYETGRGTYRVRAKYHVEDKRNIVITELPYQVSGSKLLEQIGALIDAKKLPMIEDLQDESDKHNPIRFVITLKRSAAASAEAVMGHLYINTDLEKSYKINLNMVALNGAPRVMALNEVLGEWVQFRRQTTTRRLTARVNKIDARLHVLEGLLIAHLNIDEVIRIIRENEDAQSALMKAFSLTEIQAQAILNIKLGQLAKLEEIELQREQSELQKERAELQATLDDPAKLNSLLSAELEEAAKAHANERRTQISHDAPEAKALDATQTLAANPVTVVVSDKGWVRAAKGHQIDDSTLSYKTGDGPNLSVPAKANQPVFLMSDQGRVWSLAPHLLPSARGYGEQLMQHNIEPPANTKWKGIFSPHQGDYYVVASSLGYGFVAKTNELATNQKKGKAFLNVAEGVALKPSPIDLEGYVAVLTDGGRLLIFLARELPELSKGKGNKLAKLKVGERVVGVAGLSANDHLIIQTKKDSPKYGPQKWSAFVKERAKAPESLPSYIKGLLGLSVEKR